MRLPVQRLNPSIALPARAQPGDAGLDLRAAETVTIPPGSHRTVRTGIAVGIPLGHVGLVCPRSGLAADEGVTVLNAPGVIDSGYRGEVAVILANLTGLFQVTITPGDRIAQLVVLPIDMPHILESADLTPTERGTGGFGSTGRN